MEKVNLVLVHNEKRKRKNGGNFYNVYVSGRDDIEYIPGMDIEEFERETSESDERFRKSGGIILKRDEYLDDTITYIGTDSEETRLSLELEETNDDLLELYYKKDVLFKEYLKAVVALDAEIREAYERRETLEKSLGASHQKVLSKRNEK